MGHPELSLGKAEKEQEDWVKGCHSEPLHSSAVVDRGYQSQRDGLSVARGAGVKGPRNTGMSLSPSALF